MIIKSLQKFSDVIFLFLYPIVLTLINSNWVFTPVTNNLPDPWFYFSYFLYFFKNAPSYPSNVHYFVERLSWNVPGFFIYHNFSPLTANYLLHFIVYYSGIFSLYSILRLTTNQRAAFITSLLLGGYPWFLRAAGWDYPDGAGIAHLLLLLLLLTIATQNPAWKMWLFIAGFIHASLLVTNPFWVGFFPSWAVYFILLNRSQGKLSAKEIILGAGYFIAGNLCLVLITGWFYQQVTGNFFFLERSLNTSVALTHGYREYNNAGVAINYKNFAPLWHILPAIIFIPATWVLISPMSDPIYRKSKNLAHFYFSFILAYGWLIFWHVFNNPMLIMFPYSSFIIPNTFLLLGGFIAIPLSNVTEMGYQTTRIVTSCILILPAILLAALPGIEVLQGNVFLITALSLGLLILLMISVSKSRVIVTGALLFGSAFYLTSSNSFVYLADRSKGRDNFSAIVSASQIIDSQFPNSTYKDFRLWFRSDQNYNTFFSLAAVYLYPWGSALDDPVSSKKPSEKFSLAPRDKIENNDNIVIISSDGNSDRVLSEANLALKKQNIALTLITTKSVKQGELRFFLYFTNANLFK